MHKLLTFIIAAFLVVPPAFAEDSNVEINIDALDNYTPPPMFGDEPGTLTPLPTLAAQPPAPAQISKIVPIPKKKPPFTGIITKREVDIGNEQIVMQTAKDILRQIEGDVPETVETLEAATPEIIIEEPAAPKPTIQENAPLSSDKPFQVSLPFRPSVTDLSEEQKSLILQQIFLRLQTYPNAHVEVRSYASASGVQQSPARRLSLERALAVQDFLISKGIAQERIYVRPLGMSGRNAEDYVELEVSRL